MSKIEEILENYLQFSSVRVVGLEKIALEAIKEFGKICFEAGRENNFYINGGEFVYKTYEEFLKEIEDE